MNDIVIIGGGIAGLSAAARLSHHASVILLESEDTIGYHSSGRSAAVFIEDYGNTIVRSLNSASTAYLHNENTGFLSPRGMLLMAKADDRDLFKSEYTYFFSNVVARLVIVCTNINSASFLIFLSLNLKLDIIHSNKTTLELVIYIYPAQIGSSL